MQKFLRKIRLSLLNRYSWFLIAIFIAVSFVMELVSAASPFEGTMITSPLIMLTIFFCQMNPHLNSIAIKKYTWRDIFLKDTCFIWYCFLVGSIFFVIFNHTNTDLSGWWPLFLYAMCFYGFIFSLVFFSISWIFNYHNRAYNSCFYFMISILLASLGFFPHFIKIGSWGEVEVGILILIALLSAHLLFTILLKLLKIRDHYVK